MKYDITTVEDYLAALPASRRESMNRLRSIFLANLPEGLVETFRYGMISYEIPHEIYPAGYNVNPKIGVPFLSLASQKNFIGVYYVGLMVKPDVLKWFEDSYAKVVPTKIDRGKSCIRLKKQADIPYDLIKELCGKLSIEDYLVIYEKWKITKKNNK
ncbi:hypothetical protein AwErysi_06160 [Erysipelotrichaceae bacterium]|nr:hypothetical protein AwErysi_06160 [Erysipelotrichaceae bacterium]